MYIRNGQPFDITLPQVVGDVQYPPGWFFDADQRAANGIIEVPDPAPPATTGAQVANLVEFRFISGSWMPRWLVVDKSPEQLAAEAEALKASIDTAVVQCYADVDAVTRAAVGGRTEEYRDAEAAARAFVSAGYEGDVDSDVSSFAEHNPTGQVQTNAWAADQIIARADAFRAAQKAMRAKRFECQACMRAATTQEQLAAAVAAWRAFIAGIRSALGL
jgi:hypothetical protein